MKALEQEGHILQGGREGLTYMPGGVAAIAPKKAEERLAAGVSVNFREDFFFPLGTLVFNLFLSL